VPPVIITDIEQGTPEWHRLRLAIPTASNIDKIVTSQGKRSTQAGKYMQVLMGEFVTQKPTENKSFRFMQEGREKEPTARAAYQIVTGSKVQQVAVVYADEQRVVSCSPDGLVGEEGGLEIKCPIPATMYEYAMADKLPTCYKVQVQASLWITGRPWWDFCCYCPGFPLFIKRIARDAQLISYIAAGVNLFNQALAKEKAAAEHLLPEDHPWLTRKKN